MKKLILAGFLMILLNNCEKPAPVIEDKEALIPTEAEKALIYQAAAGEAAVKPLKDRKILVFSVARGYIHKAAPWGVAALEAMAKKSAAFDIIVSDDISLFEADNLNSFDAIVFNNTNQEIFLPENFADLSSEKQAEALAVDKRLRENFAAFINSGRGLAVIHAGLACFREWPEYGEIIGARFDNHPWVSGTSVSVKVDDPTHPLNKAFKNPVFEVTDEIYQVKGNYSRDNLRVLLSIDTERTDMTKESIHRTDGDFALSWIKEYGQGRVFYFAFGHDKQIYWTPALLRHLQDGIQFVCGDLTCDTRPSSRAGKQ